MMRRHLVLFLLTLGLPCWSVAQTAAPDPDALVAAIEAAEKQGPVALDKAVEALSSPRFVVDPAKVKVALVEFDELARRVIVQVTSADPAVPLSGRFRLDLALSYAPETTWKQLRQAIKDKSFTAKVLWRLARTSPKVYLTQVVSVLINDTGTLALEPLPPQRWSFAAGKRGAPQKAPLVDTRPVPGSATLPAFLMSTVPVTQEQFETLLGRNPSVENHPEWAANHPVQFVSWLEAVEFANRLSVLDGLQPVYTVAGTLVWPDRTRSGWRLPTAAEWDWARRAAGKSSSPWAGSPNPDDVAWIKLPNAKTALDGHSVATKKPNELGLYDLTGNVQIWVEDRAGFSSEHPTAYVGASFRSSATELVEGTSPNQVPFGDRFRDRGFRLVRNAPGAKLPARAPYPSTAAQLITAYETADPDLDDRSGLEAALRTSQWTVAPPALSVSLSTFDRTLKQWTATIKGIDPQVPGKFSVALSLRKSLDLPAEYRAVAAASASSSLQVRMQWSLMRRSDGTYRGSVTALEFGQTLSGRFQVLHTEHPLVEWAFGLNRPDLRTPLNPVEVVAVKGGSYRLGGTRLMPPSMVRSDNSEHLEPEVEHPVTVSDFWMMPAPVSQALYLKVMGVNPSNQPAPEHDASAPVDVVSWYDAVTFANRLSLAMGLEPAYDVGPRSEILATFTEFKLLPVVTLNAQRNGWRLPSSAEYAWALRGKPQGDVVEWMGDYFGGYRNAPAIDPMGPATSDEAPAVRDVRGGSLKGRPWDPQYRQSFRPDSALGNLGFRLVRRGGPLVTPSWTGPALAIAPLVRPQFSADPAQGYRLVNVGKTDALTLGISLVSDRDPVFFADRNQARGVFHVTPVPGGYRLANDALGATSNLYYLDTMANSVGYLKAVDDAAFPWVPEPLADGSFRLSSSIHGLKVYLQAQDNGRGGDLVITAKNRSPLQLWKLVPVVAGAVPTTSAPSAPAPTATTPALWAVNSNGAIFRRVEDSWSLIPGSAMKIATGGGSVWMIGKSFDLQKWDGTQFVKVPAATGRQIALAVDPQGRPWTVGLTGALAVFDAGSWVAQPKGPGRFYDVALGPKGEVWALGGTLSGDGAEILRLVDGVWKKVPGTSARLTVSSDGVLWSVNKQGEIARYDGSSWASVVGRAQSVTAGVSGALWSVGTDEADGGYTVQKWTGQDWEVVEGGVTDLAAE